MWSTYYTPASVAEVLQLLAEHQADARAPPAAKSCRASVATCAAARDTFPSSTRSRERHVCCPEADPALTAPTPSG